MTRYVVRVARDAASIFSETQATVIERTVIECSSLALAEMGLLNRLGITVEMDDTVCECGTPLDKRGLCPACFQEGADRERELSADAERERHESYNDRFPDTVEGDAAYRDHVADNIEDGGTYR